MSEYRQYENGVADVISFLLRGAATVERNAYVTGKLSQSRRQVDVLVRGSIFGLDDATLVVDCKRWGTKVDVADVGAFIDLVADVGASLGLLVTTLGASDGAVRRARAQLGIHLEIMTLGELRRWRPKGTVTHAYRLLLKDQQKAERVLRNVGFSVMSAPEWPAGPDDIVVDVFRHYGVDIPSGDVQAQHATRAQDALRIAGIEPISVASGVIAGGGTPAHRWLKVTADGVVTDLKVLADTPDEVERQLDNAAPLFADLGVPRSALAVLVPEGWPVRAIFTLHGA